MSFLNRRQLLSGGVVLATPWVRTARADTLSDIELTLALDGSGSMTTTYINGVSHWDFQLKGHMDALRDPGVVQKLLGQKTHLRLILWSGVTLYPAMFDGAIETEADVLSACNMLSKYNKGCVYNSCGSTVHASPVRQVLAQPSRGYRRVLDISTDEPTTVGMHSEINLLRKEFAQSGGTINALAVGMSRDDVKQLRKTLCAPDGFCFTAEQWSDYAEALKLKILTEIA